MKPGNLNSDNKIRLVMDTVHPGMSRKKVWERIWVRVDEEELQLVWWETPCAPTSRIILYYQVLWILVALDSWTALL